MWWLLPICLVCLVPASLLIFGGLHLYDMGKDGGMLLYMLGWPVMVAGIWFTLVPIAHWIGIVYT